MKSVSLCALLLLSVSAPRAQSTPQVGPGVTLPGTGMVALLDTVNGKPKAITVHSSEIKSNPHAGDNFARGLAFAGAHGTVELDGATSALTVHDPSPVFYIRLPGEDPEIARSRATLVRLKPLKSSRQAVEFTVNAFGGGRKRKVDEIAVVKSDVEGAQWFKLAPVAPLPPGEYGITFLPKDVQLFSSTVYDFTVPGPK